MAYCTKADLDRAFHPQNVIHWADDDRDGSLSTDELATITDIIAEADAIIDEAASYRYDVPLSPTTFLKRLSRRIAGFLLAKRRGFSTMSGNVEAATIVGDYDACMAWLKDLRNGAVSLPGLTVSGDAIVSSTEDTEPVFSRTTFNRVGGEAIADDLDGTLDNY